MFAEYASLYMRIAGQVGASVPPPLTLEKAKDISEQAERFILHYVTPIFGQLNSSKFHRLLCHVLDTIKLHGNLRNGSTASNESQHKKEKVFYTRTSKPPDSFTARLVRQAQGSRTIVEKLDREDLAALQAAGQQPVVPPTSSDEDDQGSASDAWLDDGQEVAAGNWQGHPAPQEGVHNGGVTSPHVDGRAAAGGRRRRDARSAPMSRRPDAGSGGGGSSAADNGDLPQRSRAAHHLPYEKVEDIARRPGLGSLASVLGLPPDCALPVLGHVQISAKFDCGAGARQIVRATRSFRDAAWLDSVMYSAGADTQTICVGEVRVLLRLPHGDVAVLCEMAPVDSVPGCPLAGRGCTRLRWLLWQY